jgi:hypothetical protein
MIPVISLINFVFTIQKPFACNGRLDTGVDKTKNNSGASPFFSGASIFFFFANMA